MKMRAVDLDMVYLEGERGRERERDEKRGRERINQSVKTLHGVHPIIIKDSCHSATPSAAS